MAPASLAQTLHKPSCDSQKMDAWPWLNSGASAPVPSEETRLTQLATLQLFPGVGFTGCSEFQGFDLDAAAPHHQRSLTANAPKPQPCCLNVLAFVRPVKSAVQRIT